MLGTLLYFKMAMLWRNRGLILTSDADRYALLGAPLLVASGLLSFAHSLLVLFAILAIGSELKMTTAVLYRFGLAMVTFIFMRQERTVCV